MSDISKAILMVNGCCSSTRRFFGPSLLIMYLTTSTSCFAGGYLAHMRSPRRTFTTRHPPICELPYVALSALGVNPRSPAGETSWELALPRTSNLEGLMKVRFEGLSKEIRRSGTKNDACWLLTEESQSLD